MSRTPPGQTRKKVHRFVRERLLAGRPPTLREIQHELGFRAVESARAHLEALVAEGKLEKEPGKARGYRLPRRERPVGPSVLVPLLGEVAAGNLTLAVEDPEGYLPLHSRLDPQRLFALRVKGESMTGAGILPGDVVVVRKQESADQGDVVVALVDDEATVKTFRRRHGRPVLEPHNPDFETIVPPPGELRILGKVIEVRRYLDPLSLAEGHERA